MLVSYAKEALPRADLMAQKPLDPLAQGTQYSMTLINESNQNWTFYVYQKLPGQVADVFSLAWFCSPYKIRNDGSKITFQWEIDYNFTWADTGTLQKGIVYHASGTRDCSPSGNNITKFEMDPGPGLSKPTSGDPRGSLVINDGSKVPANKFSVGIGMSGTGSYAVQAGPNLKHTFTPTPSYWIAAGNDLQLGSVLKIETITQTAEARFGNGVFHLDCTLNDANLWKVSP